jgi:phosphatidylglycerol:prolipoprotein diacylglycerol transferase
MIIETSKISNIAFNIFGIDIYWYAVLIVMAIIIGILWCKLHDGRYGIRFDNIIDLLIFVLPISFICARIYYCVFAWQDFSTNIFEVFNFRNGGLAIYGGLIGASITTFVFCKLKKINFLDLIDYMIPVVALGQAIGRWGNFFNKEAYGTTTNGFIKMEIIESGQIKYVHPTFLYESLVTFLCFILLSILSKNRKYKGQITTIYLIIYSFARMLIEGIRTDSLMLYNIRISQGLSLIIFLVFSSIFACKTVKCRTREKKVDK